MTHEDYLKGIVEIYYHGEVIGEAIYRRVFNAETDPARRRKWASLLQLETQTKVRLRPLLTRWGLPLDEPATDAVVASVMENWQRIGWQDKMQTLLREAITYLRRYEALAQAAPQPDRPFAEMMLQHEFAIIDFAKKELAGDDEHSLAAVLAQLDHPAAWSREDPDRRSPT